MNEHTVITLAAYTDLVETIEGNWNEILFRGQSQDKPLIPSLGRLKLLDTISETEISIMDDFKTISAPFYTRPLNNIYEWTAVAQHHGAPTRLLDWSLNPLAALYFAVYQPPIPGSDHSVVWMLRVSPNDYMIEKEMTNIRCKRPWIYQPRHIVDRITAQSAYFTTHKTTADDIAFENFENSEEFGNKLTKIIIPSGRFAHFRFHLDRFGINEASIYPGLEGISRHLKMKWSCASDESPVAVVERRRR